VPNEVCDAPQGRILVSESRKLDSLVKSIDVGMESLMRAEEPEGAQGAEGAEGRGLECVASEGVLERVWGPGHSERGDAPSLGEEKNLFRISFLHLPKWIGRMTALIWSWFI
jgi:hypothetical protein